MNLLETCRLVLLNLIENKFKVFLTSLGILVGTITIVLVIAIGKGGEAKVADQFKDLSAETVYVNLNYKRLENKEMSQIEK
ncbi:MAG: ABC transporter permease [Anaerorhabdus sp.]